MSKSKKKENYLSHEASMADSEENKMNECEPQGIPPTEESAMFSSEDDGPKEIQEEFSSLAESEAMPMEDPPILAAVESDAFTAAVWHKNKKIIRLWSKDQNRNSWIYIQGIGWKKLANNSDSAVVALTMLSAHAKQMGRNVNLKEDSGQIKEIYVW